MGVTNKRAKAMRELEIDFENLSRDSTSLQKTWKDCGKY